ncbi:MAG: transposase [Chloroflexota bacterium]|nr:MAG: transposase [Chloroflexota bacterium]
MGYITGIAREQLILFPESLDDYIALDNPVRFIDAWVDSLDLAALGFTDTVPAETGRPGYDPRLLLKLYLYGYLNRIRSSRKLEQECQRNVEVMWLLGKLVPDHKTIADFRKDNLTAFKETFKAFCQLCRELELFGGELIAIDGSKFKAVNSAKRNFTQTKVKQYLAEMEERLAAYLQELDQADQVETSVVSPKQSAAELQAKIERLKTRQDKYQGYLKRMEESGESQLSLTDPDSRAMPKSPKAPVAYNVQSVVDSKHHLIVAQDVTNDITDRDQLSRMALAGKQMLAVEHLKAVADMGYSHGKELKTCQEAGIEPYVARPDTSANAKLGLFGKEQFVYQADSDTYTCPAGETLFFRFETIEKERQIRYYKTSACGQCPLKEKCTRNKEGRRITRWVDEHIIEQTQARVEAHPELMKQRKQLVEHPFGTIKFWWDQGHFLLRGLPKVKAEFSLSTLAYNIRRVLNILGVKRLMAVLS